MSTHKFNIGFYEEITKIIIKYDQIHTLSLLFLSIATVIKFQTPKMFVVICLECRLRDNCPAVWMSRQIVQTLIRLLIELLL